MFTGIITYLGKVKSRSKNNLTIQTSSKPLRKLSAGSSISINGICLTLTNKNKDYFGVDVMEETLKKTNLKNLHPADLVNLELPVTPNSLLSGHIVQGHIDGIGKVKNIAKRANSHVFKITLPGSLSAYVVEKGSVAVNGVSFTVIEVSSNFFTVGIIPYTFKNTNFQKSKVGDLVNLEVDILAKYLEKLVKI